MIIPTAQFSANGNGVYVGIEFASRPEGKAKRVTDNRPRG